MSKDNAFEEVVKDLRRLYRHRRGREIPAAIEDTIDALYKDDLKPLIVKATKNDSGWFFVIHLPPGSSYREFKARDHYFADATGGAIQIDKRGKAVYMSVMANELRGDYPYSWDWDVHKKMFLPFPVGYSAGGFLTYDLADAPNLLIAGHPYSGKSVFTRGLVASLLLSRFVYVAIIDLKRLDFKFAEGHALLATKEAEALQLLQAVSRKIGERIDILDRAGYVRIQDYLEDGHEMPFIVLVIDELSELQDEESQEILNHLVRIGRAPGLCVVVSTQRPDAKTFDSWSNSKAMFTMTACFHVRDAVNSQIVLRSPAAAEIPNIPGRGIFQFDKEVEFQSMFLGTKEARKLLKGIDGRVFDDDGAPQKRLPPR